MNQDEQIAQLTEQVGQLLEQNRQLLAMLHAGAGLQPVPVSPLVHASTRVPKPSKREIEKQTLTAFAYDHLKKYPNLQSAFLAKVQKLK